MTEYEDAEFWKYIITDGDDGDMIGTRDDMPESARADYEAFLEEQRYAKEHNMKIQYNTTQSEMIEWYFCTQIQKLHRCNQIAINNQSIRMRVFFLYVQTR